MMKEEEYFEAIRKIKADFITKVPANLSNEVLKVVGKRLKVKNIDKLNDFAYRVSGAESSHGKNTLGSITSSGEQAKGNYHFFDSALKTAKNRMKKILGYLPKNIEKESDARNLSEDDQKALFFSHITEDKHSDDKIYEYLAGRSGGGDLYLWHHYKPRRSNKGGEYFIPKRVKKNIENWFGKGPHWLYSGGERSYRKMGMPQ